MDYIEGLREEHTQQEIADKLGWSRDKVKNFARTVENLGTGVLDIARSHQKGRVPNNGTGVPTFDFTEYWFRTSNLYELDREGTTEYAKPDEDEPKHAQVRVMEWFCECPILLMDSHTDE